METFNEFIKRMHTFSIDKWPMRHFKVFIDKIIF